MKFLWIWSVCVMILSGCASVDVQIESNDSVNLPGFKTYAWLKTESGPGEDVRVNNPQVTSIVRDTVEACLKKKGYQKSGNESAEFLVTWFGALEKKVKTQSIEHFYSNYGYGAVAARMPSKAEEDERTKEYEEGTILIDALDPENHNIIWRGTGTARLLTGMSEVDKKLYIERVVGQILNSFPETAR